MLNKRLPILPQESHSVSVAHQLDSLKSTLFIEPFPLQNRPKDFTARQQKRIVKTKINNNRKTIKAIYTFQRSTIKSHRNK